MDPKTLFIANMAVCLFLGLALLFFRNRQKTYPGFGLWVASTFLIAAGYLSSLIRLAGPVYLSIVLNNLLFSLGALTRLCGVARFLEERKLPSAICILVPLAEVAAVSYFYLADDWFAMRVFILTLVLCATALAASYLLLKNSMSRKNLLYRAMGWLCLGFAIVFMARALLLLYDQTIDMFSPRLVQGAYGLAIMLIETAWVLGFLMMNSHRLEMELRTSQDSLGQTVAKLAKSLDEVKTLSGLLPICASCKKVRNDNGYWQQIEVYLTEHSDADFSHGICPECIRKLYPELSSDEPG